MFGASLRRGATSSTTSPPSTSAKGPARPNAVASTAQRRSSMRLALLALLSAPAARAWTAEGYPDCSLHAGPSCFPNRRAPNHHSLLNSLLNKWCSDKGTYWLSKHNYGAVYDTVLRPTRRRTRHLLELGVGDETAGSLNAWREYFPKAEFWIADIDVARFQDKKQWAWASRQKRRHGCFDDPNVWTAPRVHTLFGVDSSNRTQLRGLPLPAGGVDVIIDDASHAIAHQLVALEALWPRLIDGGFYIVEDLTIGALPWMRGAAGEDQVRRGPTNNTNCGHECQYVQRPSEHPFVKRLIPTIADQRAAKAALALGPGLPDAIERILDNNAWFFSITGAHVGGGLDSTVIIQKTEKGLDAAAIDELSDSAPPPPAAGAAAAATPATAAGGVPATLARLGSPSDVPSWAVGSTVHPSVATGSGMQLLALLLVVGGVVAYRTRLLGLWRRLIGRSGVEAE